MKSVRVLRGSQLSQWVDVGDRGFNYGDGLFETLRVHRGQPVWWREHWDRLLRGATRLGIVAPDELLVRKEVEHLLEGKASGVLKIVLTRGIGGRGYASDALATPTIALSLHVLPAPYRHALRLRWCETEMAVQPRLAGIKHLNRLEQVLARAEWRDPVIDEGLMCDTDGLVVCATAANVFALIDGCWLTPTLQRCGVAGTARQWILNHVPDTYEATLRPADLRHAQALLLCNAVRGVMPVHRLADTVYEDQDSPRAVRERLWQAVPAFADAPAESDHADPH